MRVLILSPFELRKTLSIEVLLFMALKVLYKRHDSSSQSPTVVATFSMDGIHLKNTMTGVSDKNDESQAKILK